VTLAYDAEDGAGPPVVCLPMFGTTRAVTRAALAPALAGSGRRTLWVDLPGHGDSPPAGAPTSEDVLAEVLAFLAEHDDGGGVMLAGCSYGGYLAAAVARRRPEVVRGMLLVCAGVRTSDRDLPPPREDAGPAGWLDGVAPQYRDHLGVALGGSDPAVAKTVSDLLVGGTGGDEAWRDLLHGDRFPLRDEAEVVPYAGPVSVVAGREDRVVGYADQYRLMAAYPGGTYAALAGAGHYLPFERPAMLRALAQEWLARCVT
jgi:pimeloyl-ACP methyl ester carboxylesterase